MRKIVMCVLMSALLLFSGCSLSKNPTPQQGEKLMKIIYIADPSGADNIVNSEINAAFMQVLEHYDFEYKMHVLPSYDKLEEDIKMILSSGYDLVVSAQSIINREIKMQQSDYPDQKIALIDNYDPDKTTMSFTFKMQDGAFLAGILAANETKTDSVCYIGTKENQDKGNEYGFRAGVQTVNPKIRVYSVYTDSFNNVSTGYNLAKQAVEKKKVDVIFSNSAACSIGVEKCVAEKNIKMINSDLYTMQDADYNLGTTVRNYKMTALYLVNAILNGEFTNDNIACGIAYTMVDFIPSSAVDADTQDILTQYRSEIRQYEINIPNSQKTLAKFNYKAIIKGKNTKN